jgi:parallel beta-helix repeat protein
MLFESSNNQVLDNIADYCCRIYQSGVAQERYHNGADAAALVMMCSSCGNTVRGNLLRSSGDGVFLGGFHKDLIPTPCNNNVFERNDGSDSPNIAFEATFSQHNIFRDNRANNCNYGFWLGWSSHNTVESNRIHNSRIAGIAIEHGHHNTLAANDIERNRSGIQLWTNADDARSAGLFRTYFPECAESHATLLGKNHITACETAIHAWTQREEPPVSRCHGFTLDNNILTGNRVAVLFERVRESRIARNQIVDNVEAGIKLIGSPDVLIDSNTMDRNGQAA